MAYIDSVLSFMVDPILKLLLAEAYHVCQLLDDQVVVFELEDIACQCPRRFVLVVGIFDQAAFFVALEVFEAIDVRGLGQVYIRQL